MNKPLNEVNMSGILLSFFSAVLIGIVYALEQRHHDFGIVTTQLRAVVLFMTALVLLWGLHRGPYTNFVFRQFRKYETATEYVRWVLLSIAVIGLAWVLISFFSYIVIPSGSPSNTRAKSQQIRRQPVAPGAPPSYWPYVMGTLVLGIFGVTGIALLQKDVPLDPEDGVTHQGKVCKYLYDRNNWLYDRANKKWISPENMGPYLTQSGCILLDEHCWTEIIKPVEAKVGTSGKQDVEHGSYAVFSVIPDQQKVFINSGNGKWKLLEPINNLVFKEMGYTMRFLERVDPPLIV